jgi:hypothetical protein
MIAKHVVMKSAQQGGFSGLVKYITDSQSKSERVGDVRTTNCHSDRADQAMLEVINVQAKNKRATADKNYHLIISFAPGESPDEKVLITIEDRVCAAIGFAGHQRISVAHHDTDSLHVHVAINKIHPQRYTIHEPFNAYHTLGLVCAKLEKEFGLQQVNHTAKKARGENNADDMERHADVESVLGWIKRECSGAMHRAQNWPAMHEVMRAHGLTIHERANGLAISSDAGISVKASSVAREFSKASLEKKLGAFEPMVNREATRDASTHYARQPVRSRVDTSELYARYKNAQQQAMAMRADEWTKARAHQVEQIEAVKRKGRLKRAAIKLLNMPGIEKKLLYIATSKTLLKEIEAINKDHQQQRQEIYGRYTRCSWADWLCHEARTGNKEALEALRARPSASGLKGNTLRGAGNNPDTRAEAVPDTVTKNGTLIYHVGASAVRDDGSKLKVSRGADRDGLEAALRIAIERYGNCITVNGSAEFKERIAGVAAAVQLPVRFDDAALERRRRQLTQPLKAKEKKHDIDSRSNGDHVKRRPDRSRNGSGKQNASRHAPVATRFGAGRPSGDKPDPGGTGHPAAPPDAHRMRGLSELGLVHVTNRSKVLLPGDVPGHMEHQGAKPDHRVRRHVRRPGQLKQPGVRVGNKSPLHARKNNLAVNGAPPPFVRKDARRNTVPGGGAAARFKWAASRHRPAPPSPIPKPAPESARVPPAPVRRHNFLDLAHAARTVMSWKPAQVDLVSRPPPRARKFSYIRTRVQPPPARKDHLHTLGSLSGDPASPSSQATKPNVGKVGSTPPPASKDRLQPLSKLGGVTIGEGATTTARAPVPHPVQHQVAPTPARHVADETLSLSGAARAAEKYVIEREQKRRDGFDIPKHSRYNFANEMSAVFAGIRQIDGQALALLKIGDEIFVHPVDESTALRLKRIALGQQIVVKAQGVIKTKGRSR